jgi:hypothetical protein
MFRIEDERHAEPQEGDFDSFASAVAELKRRAEMRWDEAPNVAPCTNWKDCGRSYEVVEYDTSSHPWTLPLFSFCSGIVDAAAALWTALCLRRDRVGQTAPVVGAG